jgi:DNA-binding transcriptional LysR family regulator
MRDSADATPDAAHAVNASLHQLRLFVTLARHRSFTRAGDEFGITQSAVSRSIRELEDEVELRLFDRTTRQVALTDIGRKLLARVAPLVEELEATLRHRHAAGSERGVVQLASSSSLTASVLPNLLASCRTDYPDISVALLDKPQGVVLQLVRSGEVDLGLVVDPQNVDELVAEALFTDTLCAAVPAHHPFAARASLGWRDLRGASLLLLDDDARTHAAIDRALATHDVTGGMRQRLAQASTVAQMVEAGLGIGIMPMRAGSSSRDTRVATVPLAPSVTRTVMLVRRRGHALRPGAASVWAHFIVFSQAHRSTPQTADV